MMRHQLTYCGSSVWRPRDKPRSGPNASRIPLAELWLAEHHQFAMLELHGKLCAGTLYELRLAFDGLLNIDGGFCGLFSSTYKDQERPPSVRLQNEMTIKVV
ncbi:UNVERIFIED_CONTAM: hypothetical protein K2H54_014667 [Gekko kuhli]